MEDAVTSLEHVAEAVVVKHIGTAQGEPLLGAIQRQQVRILAVSFTNKLKQSVKQRDGNAR